MYDDEFAIKGKKMQISQGQNETTTFIFWFLLFITNFSWC